MDVLSWGGVPEELRHGFARREDAEEAIQRMED